MMALFQCYLDPLSPHRKSKKSVVRVGPPLAILSGPAHVLVSVEGAGLFVGFVFMLRIKYNSQCSFLRLNFTDLIAKKS